MSKAERGYSVSRKVNPPTIPKSIPPQPQKRDATFNLAIRVILLD